MAVKLRLARHGAKKRPFYRIVAAQTESPRDGKFFEVLGTYDPTTEPMSLTVDQDRVREWLSKGALPTDKVKSLLKKAGVYKQAAAE